MDKIKDEEEEFRIRPNEHYLERTLDGRGHDERSNDRHRKPEDNRYSAFRHRNGIRQLLVGRPDSTDEG